MVRVRNWCKRFELIRNLWLFRILTEWQSNIEKIFVYIKYYHKKLKVINFFTFYYRRNASFWNLFLAFLPHKPYSILCQKIGVKWSFFVIFVNTMIRVKTDKHYHFLSLLDKKLSIIEVVLLYMWLLLQIDAMDTVSIENHCWLLFCDINQFRHQK